MATRALLEELSEAYEQRSKRRVIIESVGGVTAARRVEEGEAFDVVVLATDAIERLAAAGHVVRGSQVELVRSGVAIAVPGNAPQPDISTAAAVREAVLAARTIGYSTGPSGAYLMRLFAHWGIAEIIAPRIMQARPGVPVGSLIARGEVELGFQQFSELMHVPGIEVVGPLPDEIQLITVFSAAICMASKKRAAAEALLDFLVSFEADAAKRSQGMEPA
nr:substrate-binding domain-containing protein [Paraburkholderia sp. DHOC27]